MHYNFLFYYDFFFVHIFSQTEISALRAENRQLRNAVGAGYCDQRPPESDKKIRLLAGDLREAASSAESLLRFLLSFLKSLLSTLSVS